MNKILKFAALYLICFASIFTLNGLLSMDETHGFFYLTPIKLIIRLMIAALISIQIHYRFIKK